MRKVIYSKFVINEARTGCDVVPVGEALFHQFGVGYEELDRGTGNYSTAIIELEDGTVKSVPVECIKFVVDEPPEIFPRTYAGLDKLTIRS